MGAVQSSSNLQFAILNLGFAGVTCKAEATHPKNRYDPLVQWVLQRFKEGCSVVALQEARSCDGAPSVEDLLKALRDGGIECFSSPYEEAETQYSFHLVTCWDPKKVEHVETTKTVFDCPKKDRSFLTSQFKVAGQLFTFVNTHFSMLEDEKDAAVKQLITTFAHEPRVVVCGDFNLFMDMRGPQQLADLEKEFKVRMGHQVTLTDGTVLPGSFVGYPCDRQAKKSVESLSALLNSFGTSGVAVQKVTAPGVTKELLEQWFQWNSGEQAPATALYPTDHLGLVCEVELS